jgi:hypothetical protein
MGTNGKTIQMDPLTIIGDKSPVSDSKTLNKIAVGFIPFTPVPFAGNDNAIAWGRLVAYGLLAYFTYNKMRPASYVCMGAAGISLATSMSAGLWSKQS